MNTSNVLKKRVVIFFCSLIFIVVCLLVTFLFNVYNSKNDLIVNKKHIQVVYENAKRGINTSSHPLNYEDGKRNSPSNKIKIINKIDKAIDYDVVITTDKKDENSLETSKIYASVNGGEGRILSSLAEGIVYTSQIPRSSEETIDLKIWIAQELINAADNGKSLGINIEIHEK